MIVRMKKLTLLVSQKEKQSFLNKLRSLGVVHIKNVKKPSHNEVISADEVVSDIKSAIAILPRHEENGDSPLRGQSPFSSNIPTRAKEIVSLAKNKGERLENLATLEREIEWYRPWGGFNPGDLAALKEKGIFVRLYRAQKNMYKKSRERNDVYTIKKDAQYVYLAHISNSTEETLPFEEIKPAGESHASLLSKLEETKSEIDKIDMKLKIASREEGALRAYLKQALAKSVFSKVMHGMGEEEKFSYLSGFCPEERVKDVSALIKAAGGGYASEDPDNPEEVPTLIRNPKWIRIISPVFKFMNTIPGYKEHDISLWFLVFFSLFFAMLISDAGYGLIFIALTFLARRKLKKAPPEPFLLVYLLGFATVIWGAVTGTWFGSEKIKGLIEGNQNFMIHLCFIIGVVQLSLAHLILAAKKMNSLKALAELGWIAVLWGLFFTAGMLVLEKPFPGIAAHLFAGGALLVLLFSNPQKNMIKGMAVTLAGLPLKIVSSFSDVVSYLRLFAVGYASTVLAVTFNNMALGVGFNGFFAGLAAACILFFGHTLNIILGLMAVIVHGVRLNMLEFSGQMGMEWSGNEYKPFCKSS